MVIYRSLARASGFEVQVPIKEVVKTNNGILFFDPTDS